MPKTAKVQCALPPQVFNRLEPKLARLYSQVSDSFSSRIAGLVIDALPFGIQPNRLVKYAFLYTTAERAAQYDAVSQDHSRRARSELAGHIHGLPTGYRDVAEARQVYRRGRRSRQQIKASIEAVLEKWKVFEKVVQKHGSKLPVYQQARFSKAHLLKLRSALGQLATGVVVDEEDLFNEKLDKRDLTVTTQTYIWWLTEMPPYRGKWKDMHELASTWRMTSIGSLKSFRSVVSRMCKRPTRSFPYSAAWESVLSEK